MGILSSIISKSENMEISDECDTRAIQPSGIENTSQSNTTGKPIEPTQRESSNAEMMEVKYDTNHPKRGVAIIINQKKFNGKNLDERLGSIEDRNRISGVLSAIGFDVRNVDDKERDEVLKELKTIAEEDHSQHDCLVAVVMTHGKKGKLYASNDHYPVNRLWDPFVGNGCPSLVGKPKLFFIQACRGKKLDDGVKLPMGVTDTVDARPKSEQLHCVIPIMADLLVMYSTYDGHYSWRSPINGSWFIQSLSKELEENVHSKELLHLLTSVSRRVAYQYQSNVPGNSKMDAKKQMPCVVSTLTKKCYFPRK